MILERLKEYIDFKGLTIASFERSIGMGNATFGKSLKNHRAIGTDKLENILSVYPDISPQWLLSGEGEMIITDNSHSHVKGADNNLSQYQISSGTPSTGAIPLVSEKAVGGISNEYFLIKDCDVLGYYIIPKFRNLGVDFLIEVTGDSMMPHLCPGDIVACSIIHNSKFIQWKKCHLIATREQVLIIKRIMTDESNDNLKAISDNKEYPPFDIPKDEIISMARIVGSIHLE